MRCLGAGFYYVPAASGVRSAWRFGNLNGGGYAGVACRHSNFSVGSASWDGSLGAPGTLMVMHFNLTLHCIILAYVRK